MPDRLTPRQRAARNCHRRGWCDALRAVGIDPEAVPYPGREVLTASEAHTLAEAHAHPERGTSLEDLEVEFFGPSSAVLPNPDPPLCAEPYCPNKGRIWQDGARWCGAHWIASTPKEGPNNA